MKSTEFYITPKGGIMITDDSGTRELREGDRDFISDMIRKIGDFYPDALARLSTIFEKNRFNIPHYEYNIVSRFIRCNWGRFDSIIDIDQFGHFSFEEVECPLRGECCSEGIICNPKFNSKLSEREIEIMHRFYDNHTIEQIADEMYLSVETVKTHKRNAFKRTNTHSLAEFFLYAKRNNLFKD